MIKSFKEKILITVKTYPTLSRKYGELVCTAGIKEDGSWIRIYPIPFRRLEDKFQFEKYNWIEIDLKKRNHTDADKRPESHIPFNISNMKILSKVGTENNWGERKEILKRCGEPYKILSEIILKAKNNELSLAIFKPTKIIDFLYKSQDKEWNKEERKKAESIWDQLSFLPESGYKKEDFLFVEKIPYKFYYKFLDSEGKESTMMISDWELGQLYRNCYNQNNDERMACQKVKERYFYEFMKNNDLSFFLGTTLKYHNIGPNPFIIVGVFYPLKISQIELEL